MCVVCDGTSRKISFQLFWYKTVVRAQSILADPKKMWCLNMDIDMQQEYPQSGDQLDILVSGTPKGKKSPRFQKLVNCDPSIPGSH